jgi:ribosome-binding protein aMBF1 (putative translation factor)
MTQMMVSADRLKPFEVPRRESAHDQFLDAAQDAGICLRMMRQAAKLKIEVLAERLGISAADLKKAEKGQLVERSNDGRLIDFPAALLIRVARLTNQKSIPLP